MSAEPRDRIRGFFGESVQGVGVAGGKGEPVVEGHEGLDLNGRVGGKAGGGKSAVGFIDLGVIVDLGVSAVSSDTTQDSAHGVDIEASSVVDGITSDDSADDDLCPAFDGEVPLHIAIDVDAASIFDVEMPVDCSADVDLTAIQDCDISGDGSPEVHGLGDNLVSGQLSAFFSHGQVLVGSTVDAGLLFNANSSAAQSPGKRVAVVG